MPHRSPDVFLPVAERQEARDEHLADNMMPGLQSPNDSAPSEFPEIPDFRSERMEMPREDATIEHPSLEAGNAD